MMHFVIAPIIIPATVAALILILTKNNVTLQRIAALATMVCLLALAIFGFSQTANGPIAYFLGNWPAPFGIALVIDRLAVLMLALVSALSLTVLIYAIITDLDKSGRHFHALFLFQIMGLNGAFLTADAFNLFVFFEVLLIASYGLMVHGGGARRLHAGMQYVAFNLIGSALFLIALAIIYNVTGTLNMADIAQKIPLLPPTDGALIRTASVMFLIVFTIKGALVPFQFWLPNTYAATLGPVAALFAIMTKVGAYAVLRFGTLIFPPSAQITAGIYDDMLWPAAIATIILGAFGVLAVRNLTTLIAFAGIGSMGVIFLAISAAQPPATVAALYYIAHSTLATAALFLLSDIIIRRRTSDRFDIAAPDFAKSGLIAALFMMAAIAMIGLPPFSGFIAKLMALKSLQGFSAWGWGAILVASFITILGFARAGSALFWKTELGVARPANITSSADFIPVILLLLAITCLAILADPITDWLTLIADDLHNPAAYIAAQSLGVIPK